MIEQPQLFLIIFDLLSRDFSASPPLCPLSASASVSCSLCIYFKINCSFVAKLLEWGFHFHLQQKTVASGIAIAIGIEQCNPPCCLLPPPSAYASATAYVSCLPGSGRPIAAIACSNKICPRKGGETKGGGGSWVRGTHVQTRVRDLFSPFCFAFLSIVVAVVAAARCRRCRCRCRRHCQPRIHATNANCDI